METTNNFKPILFSTEMVQAILAGRKTQTRRIAPFDKFCTTTFQTGNGKWQENYTNNPNPNKISPGGWNSITNYKSKYQIDDILWVRETFCDVSHNLENENCFLYKADFLGTTAELVKWKPSLFMPKEAARIFLKVTNVRCERLQDISNNDAMAEGILIERQKMQNGEGWFYPKNYLAKNNGEFGPTHFGIGQYKISFETLWDSINAKKQPWESNPWVWVYNFERIDKPENFLS